MIARLSFAACIKSTLSKSREQLQRYAKSFLFNIAYNFNLVFKDITEIDDLFLQRTSLNRRMHNVDKLMTSQLSYKKELVE